MCESLPATVGQTNSTKLDRRFRTGNKPAAQAAGQTLPDATPPVGKIHTFSNIAVTFEPIQQFRCPSRFRINVNVVCFMTKSTIVNCFGVTAP